MFKNQRLEAKRAPPKRPFSASKNTLPDAPVFDQNHRGHTFKNNREVTFRVCGPLSAILPPALAPGPARTLPLRMRTLYLFRRAPSTSLDAPAPRI